MVLVRKRKMVPVPEPFEGHRQHDAGFARRSRGTAQSPDVIRTERIRWIYRSQASLTCADQEAVPIMNIR
jgi:hypothetical protein